MLDTVKTLRMLDQDPWRVALDQIDVSQAELYEHDAQWGFFERLRKEDPIHYCAASEYGPYWSVTRFNDIAHVEKNHQIFSSEPTITIADLPEEIPFQSFIQMDPPKHDVQRAAVQPVVAPTNLANLEPIIRERVGRILDELPVGETFDWVEHVSIELTTQMLATLFDFPFEERRKLTFWSDATTGAPDISGGDFITPEERNKALAECGETFVRMWHQRVNGPPGSDLISMLAHSERTRNIIDSPMEYLGNIILLIIGGNDTTRNSITGGVLALNQNPGEYDKLRQNPGLIPNMVSEIIRWQTPILGMRRRAKEDVDLFGKPVRKGDKVVMWYVSGNRDDAVIDDPMSFKIDRENARHHLSFGFGIHRCMGNRLAEMQLRVSWEEIMKRFRTVEVVGEAVRAKSNIIRGYRSMPVQVHPW
ncbi:MAG: cytochrome P450 [Pseudomonadota bacterium]